MAYSPTPKNAAERDVKIRVLYEEYIKLHPCLNTWNSPITSKPKLEPIFNAGWHGIELAFIMMSQFISDTRNYVVKRPRIELIAADIMSQMNLMAEIIDGELEDEATSLTPEALNLTQCFPFPSAPPTASTESLHPARQSPALEMLIDSISVNYPALTGPEQNSLRKVIRNITGTFQSCFSEWSVGVGIEEQVGSGERGGGEERALEEGRGVISSLCGRVNTVCVAMCVWPPVYLLPSPLPLSRPPPCSRCVLC